MFVSFEIGVGASGIAAGLVDSLAAVSAACEWLRTVSAGSTVIACTTCGPVSTAELATLASSDDSQPRSAVCHISTYLVIVQAHLPRL